MHEDSVDDGFEIAEHHWKECHGAAPPCETVPARARGFCDHLTKEEPMSIPGVPAGGLNTVGQIVATNALVFQTGQNGLAIAVALLSTHTAGSPVVDQEGRYVGFINEFDVMRALDAGKDLSKLTAEQIMRKDNLAVPPSTKISDAAKIMEEKRVLNLPVVNEKGVVVHSVSRHDLLRAWIGLGLGMGVKP
jgi:CBS domain-containing protein